MISLVKLLIIYNWYKWVISIQLFLCQSLLSININLPIVKLLVSNYQVIYFVYNFFDIHYQQHFERHVTVEDFTDMDQDTCLFFHQDFSKHHETKINGGALKIITCQKIRSALQRTLHQNRWCFTSYYTLLFLSNYPSIYWHIG